MEQWWSVAGNSGINPTNNFLGTTDSEALIIKTSNSEAMRIDPQGNVGIGTSASLSSKLEVNGDMQINDHDIWLRGGNPADRNHGIGWYGGGKIWANGGSGEFYWEIAPDGPVIFGWQGGALCTTFAGTKAQSLTWNSNGDVSVRGALSSSSLSVGGAYIYGDLNLSGNLFISRPVKTDLKVEGSFETDGNVNFKPPFPSFPWYSTHIPEGIRISNQGWTGPPWVIFMNSLDATDDYSLQFIHLRDQRKGRSGVSGVYFYENGGIEITGGSATKPGGGEWSHPSDKRLKKNINSLTGALHNLLSLKGITYEWKKPEQHGDLTGSHIGFIGQDVENVFPEWVSTDNKGFKILNTSGLGALTVEAIRELKNLSDSLAKRIDELELTRKAL